MDIRELLSSRLENILVNLTVDKCTSMQNDLTEYSRRLWLLKYIQNNKLVFEEIRQCMYDYTFKLFIFYFGEAEYNSYRNGTLKILKGIGSKFMSGSFSDAIGEEYYKLYRTATAKLNIYIQKTILLLLDEGAITHEESHILCDTFLKETHVWYSLMPLQINSNGTQCSFVRALTSVDKKQLNQYFNEKYVGDALLQNPCKGDYYRMLMVTLNANSNIMFMESFYDVPNKML